jgi:hypothetical protein
MTDLPPRVPPRTDDPRMEARPTQTSMWLVFLVVGAVILAVVAYTVDSWTSVDDDLTTQETTAPAATETTAPAATETAPAEVTPAEPAPADTGADTVDPVPEATGETTQPEP